MTGTDRFMDGAVMISSAARLGQRNGNGPEQKLERWR